MQTERGRSIIDLVALPASKNFAGASACPDAFLAPGISWFRFMALLSLWFRGEVEDRIVLTADRAKPRFGLGKEGGRLESSGAGLF
jgi:hypothetical protein